MQECRKLHSFFPAFLHSLFSSILGAEKIENRARSAPVLDAIFNWERA